MRSMQKQRGMTFLSLVITAIVIVMAGIVVMQAAPTYIEFLAIDKAAQKASAGETVVEVRKIFEKAVIIDQITSVSPKDLEISKDNGRVVVSFAYERDVHLFGPAYLVMRYAGSSK